MQKFGTKLYVDQQAAARGGQSRASLLAQWVNFDIKIHAKAKKYLQTPYFGVRVQASARHQHCVAPGNQISLRIFYQQQFHTRFRYDVDAQKNYPEKRMKP